MQKGFTPIVIIVGILLILGILAFTYSTKNSQKSVNQPQEQRVTESKYKVAVKIGGDAITGGNLWIMSADGTNKKQITKNNDIYSIHGWSPNNKMILVSQEKISNGKRGPYTLSVLDVATGNTQSLKGPECLLGKYQWLSDDEILAIEPRCRDGTTNKVEILSIKGDKTRTLLTWPKDIPELEDGYGESTLRFSPDLTWLAFDKKPCCEGPSFTPKLYVYNLKDKSKKILLEAEGLNLQGWNKDKIIFNRNESEIWEVNPDGSEMMKLLEDKEPVEHSNSSGYIFGTQASIDGAYLLYGRNVGWEQYYLSHYTSGQKIMVVKQLFNDRPQSVSLSPDNSFIVYAQRSGTHDETKEPIVCFTRFIRDDYPVKTTTDKCDYPHISN